MQRKCFRAAEKSGKTDFEHLFENIYPGGSFGELGLEDRVQVCPLLEDKLVFGMVGWAERDNIKKWNTRADVLCCDRVLFLRKKLQLLRLLSIN